MVGAGATALEAVLQYQLEHVPTPGPPDYAPDSTRVGGGLLGDAHSVKYSFRGDSFPGPFIETALQGVRPAARRLSRRCCCRPSRARAEACSVCAPAESAGPGPAYAPMNGAISTLKVPSYRFGTEEQRPQKRRAHQSPSFPRSLARRRRRRRRLLVSLLTQAGRPSCSEPEGPSSEQLQRQHLPDRAHLRGRRACLRVRGPGAARQCGRERQARAVRRQGA